MDSLPLVLVCDRFQRGASNLQPGPEVPAMPAMPFLDAFTLSHESDLHFATYSLPQGGACPRLNKEVLPHLRAVGSDALSTMIALDWDMPSHSPLTEAALEPVARALAGAPAPLCDWAVGYTTRAGMRLVYVLRQPVPVDRVAPIARGILRDWAASGLAMDPTCAQWTRIFRLPRVLREGQRTVEEPLHDLLLNLDRRLDAGSVRPQGGADVIEGTFQWNEPEETPWPEDEEARKLSLHRDDPWWKEIKRRLRGRRCWGPVVDYGSIESPEALAQPGGRDQAIHSYVGEVVSLLFAVPGTTEERVYALFWPSVVEGLEPDSHTPDWRPVLWRAVRRYFAREGAKVLASRKDEERRQEGAISTLGRVVEGMRQWCQAPEIHAEDADAAAWAAGRLIACTRSNAYVMRSNGWYDPVGVSVKQIPARIRELGMDKVMPLVEVGPSGKTVAVQAQTLIDRYGIVVRAVEGVAGSPKILGARVRGIGEDRSTIEIPLYRRRRDLEPQFVKECDEWLRVWAGERYEKVCAWIGHSLAFEDGPICALSVCGAPGIGKKMLVSALAECIDSEVFADFQEFQGFQSYILKTPFLKIDEGFPKPSNGHRDPADTFRSWVGGDPIHANAKFEPLMMVRSPLRIVFLANNLDVVGSLSYGRDLSPDDRDALVQRLLHVDYPPDAADWMRVRGGLRYTGMEGRRWVRGDSGEQSDYLLARHFLWLYENRPPVPAGSRFLVEGEVPDTLLRLLSTRSGSAPLVIETLVRMIESKVPADGCFVTETSVSVTIDSVLRTFRREIARDVRREIDARAISSVLKGLMRSYPRIRPMEVGKVAGRKKTARYFELDVRTLLQEAEELGYSCDRLAAIAARSPARLARDQRVARYIEKAIASEAPIP